MSRAERIAVSLKAAGIATSIILFFALFGTAILSALGVTFPALQTAGGIILAFIALDMIFEARIGGSTISQPESAEALANAGDIAVFPLATPILAGPGAMSGAMLLMANAKGNVADQFSIIAALLTVMAFTLLLLLAAQELREWIESRRRALSCACWASCLPRSLCNRCSTASPEAASSSARFDKASLFRDERMGGFSEYGRYDAVGLADLVRKKEISPRELLQEALERCDRVNPKLNAISPPDGRGGGKGRGCNRSGAPSPACPSSPRTLGPRSPVRRSPPAAGFSQITCRVRTGKSPRASERTGLVIFGKTNVPEFGLVPFTNPSCSGLA